MKSLLVLMLGLCASVAIAQNQPNLSDLERTARTGTSPAIRVRAIDSIAKMGGTAKDAVDTLTTAALDFRSPEVRAHAVKAMGEIKNIDALPVLQFISEDKSERTALRDSAHSAMQKIGPLTDEQKTWLENAHRFVDIDGQIFKVPKIDPRFGSSRHVSLEQARAAMRAGGSISLNGQPSWNNPRAVYMYANDLPDLKTGSYGRIDTAKIVQIIGPHDMLLSGGIPSDDSSLIYRVVGFPTAGLADDTFWHGDLPPLKPGNVNDGAFVVVVGTTKYVTAGNATNTVYTAVLISATRIGIKFERFKEAIAHDPTMLD